MGERNGEGLRSVSKEYLFHFGHFELEILVGTQVEMSRRSREGRNDAYWRRLKLR